MAEDKLHSYGSFSYKTINEKIKEILDARSKLNNTVQVAMPFVKATTTIRHDYLGPGNIGFTLGLHGIDNDVKYTDMYALQNGTDPLIGYTYTNSGMTQLVYAVNPSIIPTGIGQIFDSQANIFPDNSNFVRIPPPGITNLTIGRNKNGLLAAGQLQISIPSLVQLETLHRTFLVPGVGMILEWGQQFAPYPTNEEFLQKPDISEYMFPWHNRAELERILDKIARRELSLKDDILDKYVYPSYGQYMWMFGRVGNFQIKSNSDGSFTANVKLVGPSEDSWAYSTKNTVVPRKDASSKYFCVSDANSIYSYFADTVIGGLNLKTLLDKVIKNSESKLKNWEGHVVKFDQGQQENGDPAPATQTPTTEQKTFADDQEAYFMTWRFFVNVVVNSSEFGVKAILKRAGMDDKKLETIGLLLPYATGTNREITDIPRLSYVDDPKESFVGCNKYLRSVDPSTLIIVNELAAQEAEKNPQYASGDGQSVIKNTADSKKMAKMGFFERSATKYLTDSANPDLGFLSTGVWINHKALVNSMISGDTFLRGIVNLLERMNNATMNYWQLTVDGIDSDSEYKHPQNYTVIDANYRENSEKAVDKFLKDVHTFNKYIRNQDGTLVGSDVIDCSIDLSLPKRLFAQIATLGLLSQKEIENVSQMEVQEDSGVSMKVSDPNNTLAEMFGILSLSTKDETGQCPDLTILPVDETQPSLSTCGKSNAQTTAATAGQGYQVANASQLGGAYAAAKVGSPSPNTNTSSPEDVSNSELCRKCQPCLAAEQIAATSTPTPLTLAAPFSINQQTVQEFSNLNFLENTYGSTVSRQLLADINAALSGTGMRAVVNSAWRFPGQAGSAGVKSRHVRGLAIDIAGINENGKYYDAETPDGDQKLTQLANKLTQAGYVRSNGENPSLKKVILWQVSGHFNHLHVSRLDDTETVPPPTTIVPPNKVTQQTVQATAIEQCYQNIGNGNAQVGRSLCVQCKRAKEVVRQNQEKAKVEEAVQAAIRNFPGLQDVFRYVEIFPDTMVASITGNANGIFSNAFGASPGALSIGGDIVLPGINGLRVGELFWIDRIPAFYRAFGAFQILSIEDTIDTSGWKTKIHARFNYLGGRWKEVMYNKLGLAK